MARSIKDISDERRAKLRELRRQEIGQCAMPDPVIAMVLRYGNSLYREGQDAEVSEFAYHLRASRRRFKAIVRLRRAS